MLQMEAVDLNSSASEATTTTNTTTTATKFNSNNNNNNNTVSEVQNEYLNTTSSENNNNLVRVPQIRELIVEGQTSSHETIKNYNFPATTTTSSTSSSSATTAVSQTSPLLFSATALTHVSSAPSLQQKEIHKVCSTTCVSNAVHRSQSNTSVLPANKMVRQSIDKSGSSASLGRRVSFPKYDTELVTGYLEPANPWQYSLTCEHVDEISELYEHSCRKHNTKPLRIIQEHLKNIQLNKGVRQPLLCLKSIKLAPNDCEALEEIFKRVQYKSIDLSSCDLEESAAMALFEMLEYYEATNELDVSSDVKGLSNRAWTSCIYMISHSRALKVLKAQGNPLSKVGAENLGHALTTSNLHTLKLEHCGLKGHPLSAICLKLRHNRILKELWLAHNDLDVVDADNIADLLKVNHFIELIDISHNNIQDKGLKSIVDALTIQTAEMDRQAKAKQDSENEYRNVSFQVGDSVDNEDDDDDNDMHADENNQQNDERQLTGVEVVANNDENELREQLMKPSNDNDEHKMQENHKNSTQSTGLSMLDKLLSMNHTSEEAMNTQDENCVKLPQKTDNVVVESTELLVDLSEPADNDASTLLDVKVDDVSKSMKAIHDNLKTFRISEEFDDTHSTDSAFESASEGDISRNLSEEYTRSTASVSSTETSIETGIIATELGENLLDLDAPTMSQETLQPINSYVSVADTQSEDGETISGSMEDQTVCENTEQSKANVIVTEAAPSKTPTPIPTIIPARSSDIDIVPQVKYTTTASPIASPASYSMRRNESAVTYITQASRHYSQSTDSLCSDNSLDGSLNSNDYGTSSQLNEKLTKNDTLTRQQRPMGVPFEIHNNSPSGLKALFAWNNNLTKEAGSHVSRLLATTESIELINLGKNCLSNEFICRIKEELTNNTTLITLGLQSAHLSEQGIENLISILTFGGNNILQRIDIRDNKLTVDSLLKIEEVLKSNTTITQIDIDDEPKRLSVGTEEHQNYTRILQNIRSMCARNEQNMLQIANKLSLSQDGGDKKGRRACYAGARKISLTCYNRTFIDSVLAKSASPVNAANVAVHKQDAKRKTGCRLRSPVPSPSAISPSSSPSNRSSRFQVFLVSEPTPTVPVSTHVSSIVSTCTPSPISPLVGVKSASETSLVQPRGIKTYSSSPRSRFQVRRVYEDPKVPLVERALPPITPPIYPPATPLSKNVPKNETHLPASSPPMVIVVPAQRQTENMSYASVLKQDSKKVDFSNETTIIECKKQQLEADETDVSETSSSPSSTSSSASSSSSTTSSVYPPPSEATTETLTSLQDVYCDENEATLTGNSNYIKAIAHDNIDVHEKNGNSTITTTAQSERKSSWITNPVTVDKFLNIFQNPSAFFQRSISPEPKDINIPTTTTTTTSVQAMDCSLVSTFPVHKSTQWQRETFPMSPPDGSCKQSSSSSLSSSPVPWSSTAAATLVQSRSFLDNASKQFKDLSKQVFGPNFPLTLDKKQPPVASDDPPTSEFVQVQGELIVDGDSESDNDDVAVSSSDLNNKV